MKGTVRSKIWIKTMLVTVMMLVLGVGAIVLALFRLQVVDGEDLRSRAVDQSLQSTEISPMRGTIYDSSGTKVLAQTASVWTVAVEPYYIRDDAEDQVAIAQILSTVLGLDYENTLKKVQQTDSYFTYVKRRIETDLKDEILRQLDERGVSRGVLMLEDYKRYYPYGTTASTVLGFTGTDGQGLAGLEVQYDDELSGSTGQLVTAKNAWGLDMPFQYEQYIEAANGYDMVLTLDETVQSIVEKHLQTGLQECGALEGGTAVVMDVRTGAILALATKGDYDPNNPFTISEEAQAKIGTQVEQELELRQKKEQEELKKLQEAVDYAETEEERQKAVEALNSYPRLTSGDLVQLREDLEDEFFAQAQNKQWRNKAVSDTYYPGSVFKMITAAMALEEGVVTEDSTFVCTGQWDFGVKGQDPISCWYHAGHGEETLVDGICNSCNPYMIWLGQMLGGETFFQYFDAFGFTARTGVDLPGEAYSLFYDQSTLETHAVELATESFGQNFAITPIQMITAMCAVANGGYLVRPHIVDRMLDSDGNIVWTADTSYKRQVISQDVSARITKILQRNATSESGKNGYVPGYRVAGKTGTSEKVALYWEEYYAGIDRGMQYVVSYGGYAPADDPQYALLVFYDEPSIGYPSGGTQAGPVFSSIMAEILPYLGVDPQYTDEEYENLAESAPNILNRTIGEAKAQLNEAGYYWALVGEETEDTDRQMVAYQVPTPGSPIPKGGTVVIYTEEPKEEDFVEVPDFVGYDYSTCQYLADISGVQVVIMGSGYSGYAQSQTVLKGTMVRPGTVVQISFVTSGGVETADTDD